MAFNPLSEVHLVQLELDIDNKNQLTFATSSAQLTFFNGITNRKNYTNLTYIRKDHYIVVPENVDDIYKYNYLYYKNTDTSSKWYYAFILKAEWLSENSSKVYIKTDVWQTYQFNFNWKRSFVEREMINVSDDVRGANLQLEDLETGEYIVDGSFSLSGLGIIYVIAFSRDPHDIPGSGVAPSTTNGCVLNSIASGLWYYIGNYSKVLQTIYDISHIPDPNNPGFYISYQDDIKAVFSVPSCAVLGFDPDTTLTDLDNPDDVWGQWLTGNLDLTGYSFTIDPKITTLSTYTPRNKKLLQYPYAYLGFNPPNGNPKIYRYEDMTLNNNNVADFKLVSELNPNPNVMILPYKYKNDTGYNLMESAVISGYPNISYSTDFFNTWLAQNAQLLKIDYARQDLDYDMSMSKNVLNYANATAGNVDKVLSGQIASGVTGFATSSADVLLNAYGQTKNYDLDIQTRQAQIEKQQMLPNNASIGSSCTLFEWNYFNQAIIKRYCIKPQFAARIDQFFDMFGYKTNELKIPNTNNRPNWNYVKTTYAVMEAKASTSQVDNTIPQDDMQELKTLFNNGITLWHNPLTYLDYSQDNRTIS